jgi:hypothetical protein
MTMPGGNLRSSRADNERRNALFADRAKKLAIPIVNIIAGATLVFMFMGGDSFDWNNVDLIPIADDTEGAINYILIYILLSVPVAMLMLVSSPPVAYETTYRLMTFLLWMVLLVYFVQGNIHIQSIMVCVFLLITVLVAVYEIYCHMRGKSDENIEQFMEMMKFYDITRVPANTDKALFSFQIKAGVKFAKQEAESAMSLSRSNTTMAHRLLSGDDDRMALANDAYEETPYSFVGGQHAIDDDDDDDNDSAGLQPASSTPATNATVSFSQNA